MFFFLFSLLIKNLRSTKHSWADDVSSNFTATRRSDSYDSLRLWLKRNQTIKLFCKAVLKLALSMLEAPFSNLNASKLSLMEYTAFIILTLHLLTLQKRVFPRK